MKVAKERKSSVLASNAIHHRVDCLTSIVALLTIGGSHVITDASWLDPVGGLLISLMVIRAGWGNTMTSLLELADVTVDEEVKRSVRRAASKALVADMPAGTVGVPGGEDVRVRDIQGIKSGQNYLMEVELVLPGNWSVERVQRVENAVRERVGSKVRGVKRVKVTFTPQEKDDRGFADEFIGVDVSPRSSPEPEDEAEHQHNDHHQHTANGIKKTH